MRSKRYSLPGFENSASNSTEKLCVRDAFPLEIDVAASVMVESYAEYACSFPHEVFQSYISSVQDVRSRLNESELVIAEMNGDIVGAVTFYPDGTKTGGSDGWPTDWAGLRLLAVRPASRRIGVGKLLIKECISRCSTRGIKILGLHSTRHMTVAQLMYKKMGFTRIPKYDYYPGEERQVSAYKLTV